VTVHSEKNVAVCFRDGSEVHVDARLKQVENLRAGIPLPPAGFLHFYHFSKKWVAFCDLRGIIRIIVENGSWRFAYYCYTICKKTIV